MMKRHYNDHGTRTTPASVLTRTVEDPVEVAQLLSASVLKRLCGDDVPSGARRLTLYRSCVTVAFVDNAVVGFAGYRRSNGVIRSVHEFAIDRRGAAGPRIVRALLARVESAVRGEDCSRLAVLLRQHTQLRPFFEEAGYQAILASAEMVWLEKRLVEGTCPLPPSA